MSKRMFIPTPLVVSNNSWAASSILVAVSFPCIKTTTSTPLSAGLSASDTWIERNILIKPISSKGISTWHSSSKIVDKSKATWNSFFKFFRTLFKSGWTMVCPSFKRSNVLCKCNAKAKRALALKCRSKRFSARSYSWLVRRHKSGGKRSLWIECSASCST